MKETIHVIENILFGDGLIGIFPQEVEEVLDPFELMSRYEQEKVEASVRIEKILAEIRGILERK